MKASDADHDYAWADATGGAGGPAVDVELAAVNGAGSFAVPAVFAVLNVVFSGACRFRVYSSAAGRDADAARPVSTAYPGGRGRLYEYVAQGAEGDESGPFITARAGGESAVFFQVDGGPVTITLTIKEF